MIYPPQPPAPLILNWIDRHRDPRSFALHIVGIPATLLGALLTPIYILLMSPRLFAVALASFVGGFLLQFLGHAIDHTEPGEIRFLRKWVARRRAARLARASASLPTREVEPA